MSRPRHPDKGLEAVLREAERQGWRVERGRRYYKMKCPCDDKHLKTVHISPSDPNYLRNLTGLLKRETCWEEAP